MGQKRSSGGRWLAAMAVLLLAAAAAPAARAALPDPSQNGADSAAELGIDLEAEYANLAPRLEGLGAIPALEEIEARTPPRATPNTHPCSMFTAACAPPAPLP